jgi:hypothetical protein
MGIFGWLRPEESDDDRSLVEISNDDGDHWVADIPTEGVKETERALRDAGVEEDRDETLSKIYAGDRILDNRDSDQYRSRSARVVDEGEDLEAEQDDDSTTERDEQPAEGGWFSWW